MAKRSNESKAVANAQAAVLVARAALQLAIDEGEAARKADPDYAENEDWSARVDMLFDLREEGYIELHDIATKRMFAAWEASGCSDRQAARMIAGGYHEREQAARRALEEAEKALLVACRNGLDKFAHKNSPEVVKLLGDAIAGKPGFYRGIPSHPSNYDKLVNICLNWNGRV